MGPKDWVVPFILHGNTATSASQKESSAVHESSWTKVHGLETVDSVHKKLGNPRSILNSWDVRSCEFAKLTLTLGQGLKKRARQRRGFASSTQNLIMLIQFQYFCHVQETMMVIFDSNMLQCSLIASSFDRFLGDIDRVREACRWMVGRKIETWKWTGKNHKVDRILRISGFEIKMIHLKQECIFPQNVRKT